MRFDEKHRTNLQAAKDAATARQQAERSEDLAWMADHLETPSGAARRLGIPLASLNAWCRRNDPEVIERLRRNEQLRWGGVA